MKIKFQFGAIIKRITSFFAVQAALFTLVMSPVAMGAEAQKISKQQLENSLNQMGLNKQMTLGEFYKKNKSLFPPRIQKEIEPLFTTYKNQLMPQFEVVTSKGPGGVDVQTLRVTQNGELINIELFGNKDKFAKFQNTNLNEIDIINFDDMLLRISQGDERYRKQVETSKLKSSNTQQTKLGYPEVSTEVWKKMSQKDRAAYLVNLRLIWSDARKVLIEKNKLSKKPTKTSQIDLQIEKVDALLSLISSPAQADPTKKKKTTSPQRPVSATPGTATNVKRPAGATLAPVASDGGTTATASSDNCIVAGYVSRYTGGKCGASDRYISYSDKSKNEIVYTANAKCAEKNGSSSIACNPYVYGTPNGEAYCVNTKDPSFQIATHADGPCDKASSLGSSDSFLKADLKNGDRYSESNMTLSKEELEQKYKEEQKNNPALVENFINGMLQFNKKNNPIDFTKPLSDESINAIKNIKDVFDNDIITARLSCEKATVNKKNEKNFWGACDQLHRRYLFVAQFIENGHPGCPDGSKKVNPDTLKCMCPNGPEALPGNKCSTTPVTPGDSTGAVVQASSDNTVGKQCDNPPTSKDCICPGGGAPKVTAKGDEGSQSQGAEVYSCLAPVAPTTPVAEAACGFGCKLLKGLKVAAPWIIGAVGVYAIYQLMKPKTPTLNSAADLCPNGSRPPCAQTCTAPLALQTNGSCACASCPPGQTITNASTCSCSTTGTSATTTYTCWDGTTKVSDLTQCPAQTYTCWDGTKVTNVLNCPEKPKTTSTPAGVSK